MKRGQARSYIRLQFSALRSFYRFLVERKGLRLDPTRELQLPKMEKKLPLVLTRQQIDELLSAPLRVAKHSSCACVDAASRRRDHGAVLQQRFTFERTGRAELE